MIAVGIALPAVGPFATRDAILTAARDAEALGFDSVWATDHVVLPFDRRSPYPYPESGIPQQVYSAGVDWLDPVATLGVCAGATGRVQLATSVCVLPYRNPLVLANETATLDRLSGGRVLLGVGAGWIAEEFAAVGVPFEERGARTDEAIRALKHLWSEQRADFAGRFWSFRDVALGTRPARQGGPPVLVGGNSDAALRRAARLGDGWHGMDVRLDTLPHALETLRREAEACGRDPSVVTITVRRGCRPDLDLLDFAPERVCLGPGADDVARELDAYARLGAEHLCMDLTFPPQDAARAMEWFAEKVRPLLG